MNMDKMLYIILISVTLCFVSARPKDQEVHRLTPDVLLKAEAIAKPCIEESKSDPDVLKKLLDGTVLPNEEHNKNFIFCFSRKEQFVDEEGHFNIKRMLFLLGEHRLSKEFADTLIECNKISKENPIETTFTMSVCLNENAPVVFAE